MKRWFVLIVALQALFILGEWGKYTVQAETGRKIVLKVVPVDPRSLFMGNYMALAFDISDLNPRQFGLAVQPGEDLYGKTLFVALEPRTPYARLVSVTWDMPRQRRADLVYMRGRIEGYDASPIRNRQMVDNLRIDYGISRFYFPENRQQELLEKTQWREGKPVNITGTVSVSDNGQGFLRYLTIDGQKFAF